MTTQSNTIQPGQTLTARSICDHGCIYKVEVMAREGKFAILKTMHGRKRKMIFTDGDGVEYVMAHGKHAMAPCFKASSASKPVEPPPEPAEPKSDGGYSREITMPKTKLEGLQNFVQMIINQIEAGTPENAKLTAVDLLQDLISEANPYAEVTDGTGSRQIVELGKKHAHELCDAMAKAKAEGIAEGRQMEKRAMAEKLGLI